MLRTANPDHPPVIRPNWLSTEHDRRAAVASLRFIRGLMSRPVLKTYVGTKMTPGAEIQTDAEILGAYSRYGSGANHAVGTCAMGQERDAVVDAHLRVYGVENLRVVDCSVMPQPMSGNTNGPVMALAWRFTDLLREERGVTASRVSSPRAKTGSERDDLRWNHAKA